MLIRIIKLNLVLPIKLIALILALPLVIVLRAIKIASQIDRRLDIPRVKKVNQNSKRAKIKRARERRERNEKLTIMDKIRLIGHKQIKNEDHQGEE